MTSTDDELTHADTTPAGTAKVFDDAAANYPYAIAKHFARNADEDAPGSDADDGDPSTENEVTDIDHIDYGYAKTDEADDLDDIASVTMDLSWSVSSTDRPNDTAILVARKVADAVLLFLISVAIAIAISVVLAVGVSWGWSFAWNAIRG